MSSLDLIRWGAIAAMVAGPLLLVLVLLSEVLPEGVFYLIFLVGLLLMVALLGLHARQARRSGPLGRIGLVVALIGTGALGARFALVGVAETLFGFNPDERGGAGMVLLVSSFIAFFVAFLVGIVLFGIATFRAGVLPRGAAVLFALGLPAGLALGLLTGAFFEEDATLWGFYIGPLAFAIGLLWLGYALWSGRGAEEHSSRVR
jgi:hypothetical protein